jgi:predicted ATPase
MDFYIKEVAVTDLFDEGNNYKIEFIEGCNCIFGGNGTGKTTLINLIVNTLSVEVESLSKTPFTSLNIYLANTGMKRKSKFITVTRSINNDNSTLKYGITQIKYELAGVTDPTIFRIHPAGIGYDNRIDAKYGEQMSQLRKSITTKIDLTHVPLTRFQDSDSISSRTDNDEIIHFALRGKKISNEEITEILDPSIRMLTSLQKQFILQANENRKKVNGKLDVLKSTIIEKTMIDDSLIKQVSKAFNKISQLVQSEPEEINIPGYIEKLKDAGISVPDAKISEHFKTWQKLHSDLHKDFKNLREVENDGAASTKKKSEANQKYSTSYFSLFVMTHFHDRFMSIVKEVESMQNAKELLTKSFRDYEDEINDYFKDKKKFKLTEDGHFKIDSFMSKKRILSFNDLSSGEKHILMILGRAALSSDLGTVFVADEPELSLHLDWQRKILPSIIKLSPKSQIIVATHSPSITAKNAHDINLDDCRK